MKITSQPYAFAARAMVSIKVRTSAGHTNWLIGLLERV